MPHIIIEYPQSIEKSIQVDQLLTTIHNAIAESGLYNARMIKSRAYPFSCFSNAGEQDPYIHIQVRIKSGRDAENKVKLSQAIVNGLEKIALPVSVTTVEVIDMDRDSYAKL